MPPTNNQPSNMTPNSPAQNQDMIMKVLSYIGPLVIIPLIAAKDNSVVKFHLKQGLVVFAIEVIAWIIGMMFAYQLAIVVWILDIATLVLSIIGLINVFQNKEKELPLVGQFSKYFTF